MVAGLKNCVAYCAELNPSDLETVVRVMEKPLRQNILKPTLLSLTRNRFMMCPSPFSSRVERDILEKSTGQLYNNVDVKKTLKEQRKVTVLQTGSKSLLLKQTELVALAESKVKRSIVSKKMVLRRLDSESALKLLTADGQERKTEDSSRTENKKQGKSNAKGIASRHVHTEASEESLQYTVSPYGKEDFNNPSYPIQREKSVEKAPIQATTDVELDCPSYQLAINAPSLLSSQETSSPSRYTYDSSEYTSYRQSSNQSGSVFKDSTFLNPSPPRYQDYMTSSKRLNSFKTPLWLVNEKPDVSTLVDLGFFFTGRDDLVRCFQCGIGLKDWMKDDYVLKEHVKHSSSCAFLLQTASRLQLERTKFEIASESASPSSKPSGSQLPYRIKSPRYQTMEARLASFESYPSSIGIRTQLLAVAGLFYTGREDLCRCFVCDGGLKDWSAGDDPCKEHATYFPHCGYINQLKGSDYVRARQQERQNNAPEGAAIGYSQAAHDTYTPALQAMNRLCITDTGNNQSGLTVTDLVLTMGYSELDVMTAKTELERKGDINPTADKIVNAILDMQEKSSNGAPVAECTQTDDLQAIAEENAKLTEVIQCMLCVTEEPDVLFLPCAHHRVCHTCAEKLTRCPKCNRYIKEKVRTFRA